MIGAIRKLERFFMTPSGRAVVLPLDHGAGEGMIKGLDNIPGLLADIGDRPVQGVVLNKGTARAYANEIPTATQLVVQLSAGTRHGQPSWNKSLVCSIPEALRLGADAVAVQVNIGNELEDRMLTDLGLATEEAHQHGLPVMAVIVARGGNIVQELDPSLIAHCVRLGGELGPDMVCVPYSGHQESFGRAVDACPVPVLVGGGPAMGSFDKFLKHMEDALESGAAGVSIGRNIFQHSNPMQALDRLLAVVHKQHDAEHTENSTEANSG